MEEQEEHMESEDDFEEEYFQPVDNPKPPKPPPMHNDGGRTFRKIVHRMFEQLGHTTSKKLLSERNETAFLICLLNKRVPDLKNCFGHVNVSFLAICQLVHWNITNQVNEIEIPCIIDSTKEDAEFLKYLLWMTQFIVESNCPENKKLIEEYDLVRIFMKVLVGPSRLLEEMREITNLDQLEMIALESLCTIAKKEPLLFLKSGGLPEILSFIRNFGDTDGVPDGSKKCLSFMTHILRNLLDTVDSVTTSKVFAGDQSDYSSIIQYLRAQTFHSIVISVITKLTVTNFLEEDEAIICNLLLASATYARNIVDGFAEDTFDNYVGVKIVTRLIRQLLYHPAHERHMNPLLHIAVADCVLQCIAESPSSMETFLGHEGLLRLLDLLELSASPSASLHILNSILGLCEYPRCMDQLLYWKRPLRNRTQRLAYGDGFDLPQSKGPGANRPKRGEAVGDVVTEYDETLAALLCDMWRDEEKRWGVLRDDDGCITSIFSPLKSKYAREYTISGLNPPDHSGPSNLDMIGSIRPKIFLLVNKITQAVNTEAQLFDGLSLKNQITMQIIINFLDLKRSEVWFDIKEELKREQFPFVPTDKNTMKRLIKVAKNKVTAVIETQRYLIQREKEKSEIHEREFYKLLNKCYLQEHLEAVREADYFAKTSNYKYLVEKRLWQKAQLLRAVVKHPPNVRIHRTTDGPLNITVWPGGTKILESEPKGLEETGEESTSTTNLPKTASEDLLRVVSKSSRNQSFNISSATSSMEEIRSLNISMQTAAFDNETGATPKSEEENVYFVPPDVLARALQQLMADEKKHDWLSIADEDTYWKIRMKWKKDWYPEESIKLNILHATHQ